MATSIHAESRILKSEAIVHAHPSNCLNCGAAVHASFCQYCGQETAAHVPSAREFLHEFVGHYIALENRLWKTLALLLFKPGRLTRDYLEGKRVRYVLPLRVYLTMSLVFFAVFKYYDAHQPADPDATAQTKAEQQVDHVQRLKDLAQMQVDLDETKEAAGPMGAAGIAAGQATIDAARRAEEGKAAKAAGKAADDDKDDGQDVSANWGNSVDTIKGSISRRMHGLSPKLGSKADKFMAMNSEERNNFIKKGLFAWLPYAIFAMMPVFALYLKLLYLGSGRLYGEHLLFAFHTNAFTFLVLTLMLVLPDGIPYVHKALGLWLVFYLPTAMRKVYGGSRKATFVRWMVLMGLHMLGMLLAIAAALALTILA